MKEIVKFRPVHLNKILSITLGFGIIFSILFYHFIELNYQITFFICSLVVLLLVLYSFYLNKNDLDSIVIEENMITLYFVNKLMYEKKPVKYNLCDLQIKEYEKKLVLNSLTNSTLIAVIRKEATEEGKWELLKKIFFN